jgi:4-hydroxyphenylpyruvate dioxygenase
MEPPFPLFPGQGQLPLVEFACDLTRCGYRGPWSLEIFNDGFRASPNGATAKDGYRSLLWLEEQTRRRLDDSDASLFHARRCRTISGWSLSNLPPARGGAGLGQRLSQLGFVRKEATAQTGDAVAQRRGASVVNPSRTAGPIIFTSATGSRCAMALRVSRSAAIVSAPAPMATPPGRAMPGRTKARSRRFAPPTAA